MIRAADLVDSNAMGKVTVTQGARREVAAMVETTTMAPAAAEAADDRMTTNNLQEMAAMEGMRVETTTSSLREVVATEEIRDETIDEMTTTAEMTATTSSSLVAPTIALPVVDLKAAEETSMMMGS